MTARRLFLAALTTLTAAAGVPAAAAAVGPVFSAPSVISSGGTNIAWPKVVAAPNGAIAVAWGQSDGSNLRVHARTRSAAGVWSDVQLVSDPGEDAAYAAEYLISASRDGTFVLAWMNSDHSRQYVSVKQPDAGTWTAPTTPPIDAGEYVGAGHLTAGPEDSTVLITTGGVSGDNKLRIRTRPAGSDEFAVTSEIDQPDDQGQGSVSAAYNEDGDGVAVWQADTGGTPKLAAAYYDADTAGWSAPQLVAETPNGVGEIRTAISNEGRAAVIWTANYSSDVSGSVSGVGGGDWTEPVSLPVSGPQNVLPAIVADGTGNFVAAWQEMDFMDPNSLPTCIYRSFDAAENSWDPPRPMNPGSFSGAPSLAASANGDLVATFLSTDDGATRMLAAAHWPSGSDAFDDFVFVKRTDTASDGDVGVPTVAIDGEGNVSAVFGEPAGSSTAVGFLSGDGAGPRVDDASVPTAAVAGSTVSFSSSAFDLWSGLDATTWDFGDGAGATGTTVQHIFRAAGTYNVELTASDVAGFDTVVSKQIVVTPAPVPPTPPASPARPAPRVPTVPAVPAVPKKPAVAAPVIEAQLAGRTIKLTAELKLRKGKKCSGKATVTTRFGTRTYRTTLKLRTVGKTCVARGTIKLKKSPSTRTKLRVTISSGTTKTRTITTKRA